MPFHFPTGTLHGRLSKTVLVLQGQQYYDSGEVSLFVVVLQWLLHHQFHH
jgi:hypothetical protein